MSARVVVLTGAGVSADSGVPTFRGAGGLWEGRRVEEVATPEAWAQDPAFVWRFYQLRRAALREVEPNAAHRALVELERGVGAAGGSFLLVTQNVDDLHRRAGAEELLHMHGELRLLRCEACGHTVRDEDRVDPDTFLPCERCGHERLRPDVVWFGEVPYHLERIQPALESATHFLAIGTSGQVWPAAGFLELARGVGAETHVFALDPPENADPRDAWVQGRAAETVPEFVRSFLARL